jgi:biopolymer transport protein ExbB/TolQ
MYVLLATWVVVLAGILDRLAYALGRFWRQPLAGARKLIRDGDPAGARRLMERERALAASNVERIDAVSQIAPSLGLFGTVLGMAQAFFARQQELNLAAPEVLAGGLATALYTTIAGLIVFLCSQIFLIAWREWQERCERSALAELSPDER